MKILMYCQHVLGIGHFFRTLEICRALSGHQIVLVTGGARIDIELPEHIQEVSLPGLAMDRNFKSLFTAGTGNSVLATKQERRRALFKLYKEIAPDLFIIELYPFGRGAFGFEIDPVLKGIRHGILKPARVVCSLRDVLVDKKKYAPSYEARVISAINRYFDALLIHADPDVLMLDETFSRVRAIAIPIVYTGYVTAAPPPNARTKIRQRLGLMNGENLIVASLGGGRVGEPLLEAVIPAFKLLEPEGRKYLQVFTGPLMDQRNFDRLKRDERQNIRVERFTPEFLSYLAAADLSVSMAGYNTCMNTLAANVPALVWPFSQNREQRLRAERLTAAGSIKILADHDIRPDRLADLMEQVLAEPVQLKKPIDLNGAATTAKWLEKFMAVN